MTTAEARETVGDARLAVVAARHHHRNMEKAMGDLLAAVRAEERERTIRETLDKHLNCMPEDDVLYAWLLSQLKQPLDTPPANAHIPSPSTRDVQC